MRRRTLLGAGAGLALAAGPAHAVPMEEADLDLLLVLAADISHSMQASDLRMQREGYLAALRDPDVLGAVQSGVRGAIGLAYLEWSGAEDQRVLVPWARLADAGDAARFAEALAEAPQRLGSWTSISGAIAASRRLLSEAPFSGERRVIDISGDGENNHGGPPEPQRDLAVEERVTINGLPIVKHGARWAATGEGRETPLEAHYRGAVIGGPGAFLVPALGFEAFAEAIRRKLVLEIAGRVPDGSLG